MAQGTVWGAIALGLAVALGGCGTSAEQQSQEGEPQVVVGGTQPADQADGAPAVLTVARGKDSDFPIVQPIRCTLGKDCFVLLYPDRDPSSNAKDFTCGQLTYDGHKGTDFAIDSWTPETDVPVLASAPGTVLAVRDGVRDYRIASPDEFATVKGIECGNGILMAHDDGWTTQYCHLERGSVSVRQGDRLDAGDPIGMVGLSGKTTFPHVHLTVRHNNKVVDPFVGKGSESGCDIPVRSPLWSQPDVNYVPTGLIRSGFSDGAVEEPELWLNGHRSKRFSSTGPALVFWAHTYGVQTGDQELVELRDPSGKIVADFKEPVQNSRRVYIRYIGKTTRNGPLPKGTWTGRFRLVRQGKTLIDVTQTSVVD